MFSWGFAAQKSESVGDYFPHNIYFFPFSKLKFIFIAKSLENAEKHTRKVMYPYPTTQRQLKTFPWDTVLKVHFCCENYVYFLSFCCILTNSSPENLHYIKAPQQCMSIPLFPYCRQYCFKILTHLEGENSYF